MSAQPAPRPRATGERSQVLTDADLLQLLDRDATAMRILLFARMRARGALEVQLHVHTIVEGLGLDRRTVQRANARIRLAGIRVDERQARHGGSLANRYVLDRRRVEALRPSLSVVEDEPEGAAEAPPLVDHERREGAAPAPLSIGSLKASSVGPPTSGHTEEGRTAPARAGPAPLEPPRSSEEPRQTRAAGSAVAKLHAAHAVPPGLELEPEESKVRRWLAGRRRKIGIEGARFTPGDLDRACRYVELDGGNPFTLTLVRLRLEDELGIHQLALGESLDLGVADPPEVAHTEGNDGVRGPSSQEGS